MKYPRYIENLIARFRDLPEDDSPLLDRGTKGLDGLLEVCVERHQIDQETTEEIIQRNWARIIGPAYAQRCAPEKIDARQHLLVRVPNSVLRRELAFHEDKMMTVLRSLPGCEGIQGITFRAG